MQTIRLELHRDDTKVSRSPRGVEDGWAKREGPASDSPPNASSGEMGRRRWIVMSIRLDRESTFGGSQREYLAVNDQRDVQG